MRNNYKVRAARFIREILPYIKNNMYNWNDVENGVKCFNATKTRKVKFDMGSARFVLISSDYVVKWDYDFENVKDIGGCDDEMRAYNRAVKEGFSYLLAESSQIEVEGFKFNIMPRIGHIGRMQHKYPLEYYLTAEEYYWITNFTKDTHNYNWGLRGNKAIFVDYAMTEEVIERGE